MDSDRRIRTGVRVRLRDGTICETMIDLSNTKFPIGCIVPGRAKPAIWYWPNGVPCAMPKDSTNNVLDIVEVLGQE